MAEAMLGHEERPNTYIGFNQTYHLNNRIVIPDNVQFIGAGYAGGGVAFHNIGGADPYNCQVVVKGSKCESIEVLIWGFLDDTNCLIRAIGTLETGSWCDEDRVIVAGEPLDFKYVWNCTGSLGLPGECVSHASMVDAYWYDDGGMGPTADEGILTVNWIR